jgi:site-specific DNA-cytosine methylase
MNSDKIILDLCGGTGAWSKPYKEAGYDVRIITLPHHDVTEYILGYSGIKFKNMDWVEYRDVYGILAAPPCTMFSLARTTANTPRNFKEGMEIVYACLEIIWNCRYENKLKFWALENPMGYLRQFLGKPIFTFDPCDFGDPYTKKTDLWGYYNIPKKTPVVLTEEQKYLCSINNRKLPIISNITGNKQAARRAITPPKFAKAFYKANK